MNHQVLMAQNLRSALTGIGFDIVNEVKQQLTSGGHVKTGALRDGTRFTVTGTQSLIQWQFFAGASYWKMARRYPRSTKARNITGIYEKAKEKAAKEKAIQDLRIRQGALEDLRREASKQFAEFKRN